MPDTTLPDTGFSWIAGWYPDLVHPYCVGSVSIIRSVEWRNFEVVPQDGRFDVMVQGVYIHYTNRDSELRRVFFLNIQS